MVILKIIMDTLCLIVIIAIHEILPLLVRPYERGFYCNDETISYPYQEKSTVPGKQMFIVGISVPIVLIIVGEYIWRRDISESSSLVIRNYKIPSWVLSIYSKIVVFLFGQKINGIATEAIKYQIGRLRPFFMQICKPNIDCRLPNIQHVYIQKFNCTNKLATAKNLRYARKSFPSGHSSFSFYVAIYLALYLHLRLRATDGRLIGYFLQFICIMMASFTALSRISDYKHHWSDVLAGTALGATVALIMVFFVADFFAKDSKVNKVEKVRTQDIEITPQYIRHPE